MTRKQEALNGKAKRARKTPAPPPPGLVPMASYLPRAREWLWSQYFPRGVLVTMEGRKAVGKSTMAAAIVAAVTGGPQLPGMEGSEPRYCGWVAREDGYATVVRPRLDAAGAALEFVDDVRSPEGEDGLRPLVLPNDLDTLTQQIMARKMALLVLDPYVSCAAAGIDVRTEQGARSYLEPLGEVMEDLGCMALLTRHIRKGTAGDPRDAGLGSVAVGNVARVVVRLDEHPREPGQFILSVVATNAGPRPPSLTYRLVQTVSGNPRVEWTGESDLRAEQIAESSGSDGDRDEWTDAEILLARCIRHEWVTVEAIEGEAFRAGVSPRTLRRAKASLKVLSRRVQRGKDGHWEWGPPLKGWPAGLSSSAE